MQGEDEIASIGYCLGASMAGLKSMTATSGPGISLYSEQISFAIGSEIPLVIIDVQRLGPSTGSATRGADGDDGYITTDYNVISRFQNRLKNKIESAAGSFAFHESFIEEEADTLLITYGVTSRAAKAVYDEQKKLGRPVSLLILKTLWPVPEKLIRDKAETAKRVFVFEMKQYITGIFHPLKPCPMPKYSNTQCGFP
jgi:pyruvate/2-oxoacid:ferredoxin oxidoreductase alpha subunit